MTEPRLEAARTRRTRLPGATDIAASRIPWKSETGREGKYWRTILVSIGANLPGPDGSSPLETCRRAAVALDALPGLRLRGLSRWFATAPVLPERTAAGTQPCYVNAMAHLMGAHGACDRSGFCCNV